MPISVKTLQYFFRFEFKILTSRLFLYIMIKNIVHQYIFEQLMHFKDGNRCCQKFCGSFRSVERIIFADYAFKLGYNCRPLLHNGIEFIKMYKKHCLHFMEQVPELHLAPHTEKELFMLQRESDFIGSQLEMQMSPEFFSPNCARPSIPPHRFSLGLKQSMARQNDRGQQRFQEKCSLHPYKTSLLEALQRTRVLIVNGDCIFEKSTGLPMYIIESCAERRAHCKIICVEREQLLAIHNSEKLSEYLGEKVGNTVAFQIHLQSRISEGSNLIYTTSSFLLRVLMGQSIVDSFRHISHVIVCDVTRHEAFTDLLLCELRAALRCHAHLKIILLSNSRHNLGFLEYFGEGEVLQLEYPAVQELQTSHVFHLEDIQKVIETDRHLNMRNQSIYNNYTNMSRMPNRNYFNVDRILENYELTGADQALETFLYMVRGENVSIDYRHSITGKTAIIIAAKLGNVTHIKMLLEKFADPYIMDKQNLNAVSNAIAGGNMMCIELLSSAQNLKDMNPTSLDYNMVMDLIKVLMMSTKWEPGAYFKLIAINKISSSILNLGNLVIIVADYEQLLRINYWVLRCKMIGDIPPQIVIYMLHNNIEKDQLEEVIKGTPECKNIVITTDIIESVILKFPIKYVIDLARARRIQYTADTGCKELVYEWISREALENRARLTSRLGEKASCFRFISGFLIDKLPLTYTADLLTMPLDRICLTVKLLSPHTMVAEYLQSTICKAPFINVHNTVEFLKKIYVFDELEEVTWLGCRLIDVPIDCQLGKLLVFAILLQCLDPVLTIVSFLSTFDPLELPTEIDNKNLTVLEEVRSKVKIERKRLAENILSDHLIYLRLYQEWQNNLRDDNPEMVLIDEHDYVLNGILEKVCDIRTHLVGALRSSQLIHNQGQLSMHYINLKSNSWPMIKATLVAGLYPCLSIIDTFEGRLRSNRPKELVIHPTSVLRDLTLGPLNSNVRTFPSHWIVYGNVINSANRNSTKCCSLVTPLTVAMFAGPPKIDSSNLCPLGNCSVYQGTGNHIFNEKEAAMSIFYIDDWIEIKMEHTSAQLLLKTRQYFYSAYMNFLQNCGSIDKWRRTNTYLSAVSRLFDTFERIFAIEDQACGFVKPLNIGLRPKAVPNKFITSFNAVISWSEEKFVHSFHMISKDHISKRVELKKSYVSNGKQDYKFVCLEKQFFAVYISQTDSVFRKYPQDWLREAVSKVIEPCLRHDKLTFVILYNKNPDQFCMIAVATRIFGTFRLQEYFKNKIPISEVLKICLKQNICMPPFGEKRNAFQIDAVIGKIILNLFAFRNNWLDYN
ncbi:PREDICTED: benign gonial cell neoplasm protein [Rhagoletis zephyria]|uniref:benign gonial cell neoplasm protein n=1 Tax=Rhagoletis zephyria TaxID=28612 RepID=UPI000811454A|nr:PREDICTED: benign gonial cell neoplasm protein [Rhagoletis zephyria]